MTARTHPTDLSAYLRRRMDEQDITSIRALAARVGVAKETARRMLIGRNTPAELTLRKVADGLPAPLGLLRELAGRPAGERAPFVLPPEADQLGPQQRAVIVAMVRVLLAAPNGAGTLAERDYPRLVGRARDTDRCRDTPDGIHPGRHR